jgi:hypothetical protein
MRLDKTRSTKDVDRSATRRQDIRAALKDTDGRTTAGVIYWFDSMIRKMERNIEDYKFIPKRSQVHKSCNM